MIKKVKTIDLKMGMYIHDLNVPWLEHGFARSRFMIQNEEQIEKILNAGISELYIDTKRGLDATHAITKQEAEAASMDKLMDIASGAINEAVADRFDEKKWVESRQIHTEAVKVIANVMHDARIGKQVNVEQATPMVVNITDAILGNDGTLVSLCRIKQRDSYTFQHCVSVSALLVTFCNSIGGFSENNLIEIGLGGLFHDIGKMKIPGQILNKPGSLTEAEFAIMRTHVTEGVDYLRAGRSFNEATLKIVAEHHERFDGTGYPKRISRNAISLLGQMTSIVDVYDAITSVRCYHTALEPPDALQRMFEWSGKHFDETLMHQFIKAIGIYPVGSLVRLKSGRLAVTIRQGEKSLLQPLVRVVYDAWHGCRLPPTDVDLASRACQDQIVGYESSSKWGINPIEFIGKSV